MTVPVRKYDFLKALPCKRLVRESDLSNFFNETLYAVRFVVFSSY